MSGIYDDRQFIVTRGDSRIAVMLQRNQYTAVLSRNDRFLIDDPLRAKKLCYELSKPVKVGHSFNNKGVMQFVMQETVSTDDDNHDLAIADYYKWFSRPGEQSVRSSVAVGTTDTTTGRQVWL